MFKRQIPDLPGVAVPDWELLHHLELLFDPYRPIQRPPEGDGLFTAADSRGTYGASTLEELKREIDAQADSPHAIRLLTIGKTAFGVDYELGVELSPDRSSTLLYCEDESVVTHFATRIRELVLQASRRAEPTVTQSQPESLEDASLRAADRYTFEQLDKPQGVNIVIDVRPPPKKPRIRRAVRYLYEHYIKTIITSVSVALIVTLILHFVGAFGR